MSGHEWTDFEGDNGPITGFCRRCNARCSFVWNETEQHWVRETKAVSCLDGLPVDSSVRERLSNYAHEAWSGYMTYFLDKLEANVNGDLVIPVAYVSALRRQASTLYVDLSEVEKDYDRDEADKMLAIVKAAL